MQHTLLFFGDYATNQASFSPDARSFTLKSGASSVVKPAPPAANGIRFGYMTRAAVGGGKEMICVSANMMVVKNPVTLIPSRHSDGKGYGPNRYTFGDRSATNLVADMVSANPTYADGLRDIARGARLSLPEFSPAPAQMQTPDVVEPSEVAVSFGDPARNALVERAAIEFTTKKYAQQGWSVVSVERDKIGYDLVCTLGNKVEHVEVKGASGSRQAFIITANEVASATSDPLFVLCLVVDALGNPSARGWPGIDFLAKFTLSPVAFSAVLASALPGRP